MTHEGCKVDRLIEKYEVSPGSRYDQTVDEYLLARWHGKDGFDSEGYRPLTDWFNKRLLKKRYDQQGRSTIRARLDAEYDVLTGDNEIAQGELAHDLELDGMDAEELQTDLISWSTMRHHLTGCLGEEKGTSQEPADWERESIDVIRNATEQKLQKVVNSLASKNEIQDANEAIVGVEFRLSCPECPTRVTLEAALDQGFVCKNHAPGVDNPESLLSSE